MDHLPFVHMRMSRDWTTRSPFKISAHMKSYWQEFELPFWHRVMLYFQWDLLQCTECVISREEVASVWPAYIYCRLMDHLDRSKTILHTESHVSAQRPHISGFYPIAPRPPLRSQVPNTDQFLQSRWPYPPLLIAVSLAPGARASIAPAVTFLLLASAALL